MSHVTNDSCNEVLGQIDAALDGDLDAAGCRAVEAHCQTCADCATVVEGLRQTVGLCRDAAQAALPDSVRTLARDRMRHLLALHPPRRCMESRKTT